MSENEPHGDSSHRRRRLPVVGGLLAISAAGLCFFLGVLGLLSVPFGLAGGIMALRRKHFIISLVGVCFMIVADSIILAATILMPYPGLRIGLVFGLPVLLLSKLSLILIASSKTEFS